MKKHNNDPTKVIPDIHFDKIKLRRLRREFAKAVLEQGKRGSFKFMDHEMDITFAAILIDYLEKQLEGKK